MTRYDPIADKFIVEDASMLHSPERGADMREES